MKKFPLFVILAAGAWCGMAAEARADIHFDESNQGLFFQQAANTSVKKNIFQVLFPGFHFHYNGPTTLAQVNHINYHGPVPAVTGSPVDYNGPRVRPSKAAAVGEINNANEGIKAATKSPPLLLRMLGVH